MCDFDDPLNVDAADQFRRDEVLLFLYHLRNDHVELMTGHVFFACRMSSRARWLPLYAAMPETSDILISIF